MTLLKEIRKKEAGLQRKIPYQTVQKMLQQFTIFIDCRSRTSSTRYIP